MRLRTLKENRVNLEIPLAEDEKPASMYGKGALMVELADTLP